MRLTLIYDSNNHQQDSGSSQIIQSFHQDVDQAITAALQANGHEVIALEANQQLEEQLLEIRPDFAFNCSINCRGEEKNAYAPGIFKKLGIPFTGSDGCACQNAFSKERAKFILHKAGIPTPRAITINDAHQYKLPDILSFPLFLKPVKGGCSYGISQQNLIADKQILYQRLPEIYRQVNGPLLLEEFLPGREFTVGVLGNGDALALPIMEFCYQKGNGANFRSYSLKMVNYEQEELICPAELKAGKRAEIKNMALKAFKAIGCRDYARVDLRMDRDGQPFVLEINALPNLMPDTSSYAIMAKKAGLPFRELIRTILRTASARYNVV